MRRDEPTSRTVPAATLIKPSRRRRAPARRGISMLYVCIVMVVVFAFATLAMDYGRVQLARTQLQTATDSTAKWGVRWVSASNASTLRARCNEVAGQNQVNNEKLVLSNSNIVVGYWNGQTRVFKPNLRPRNAIQISASSTVPLVFGGQGNISSCTVDTTAIATCTPMGIVALSGFSFHVNTFIGSYDSSVTTHPTQGTSSSNAAVVSNGYIGEHNNSVIRGDVYVGPGGSVDPGFSVSGGVGSLPSAATAPAEASWSPAPNPGNVPQSYVHASNTTLLPGTYWFTSLKNTRALKFSGPATIYVNGNIDAGDDIKAYNNLPANLKIYQIGANRHFNMSGGNEIIAQIVAPRSNFEVSNNVKFYGTCVFNRITAHNNSEFYYDESSASVANIALVR